MQEGKVLIPLGATVHGDVVVSVYHMRSTIGGRLQAKVGVYLLLYGRGNVAKRWLNMGPKDACGTCDESCLTWQ